MRAKPPHIRVFMQQRLNEAAGIPRGKRGVVWTTRRYYTGFNEAAGIPRGKPLRFCSDTFVFGLLQ